MKRNPKQLGDKESYAATRGCLRILEDRIELFQGCLNGKETIERPHLLATIKEARQRDDEMLAAIDKEIANLKSQIKELGLQAAKFRREIEGN